MTSNSGAVFDEPPDIVVHVEDGFADGKVARDIVAHSGHPWNGDMQMAICGGIQGGLVGGVFLLVGDEDVDSGRVDLVTLEGGQGFLLESVGPFVGGYRDDPGAVVFSILVC